MIASATLLRTIPRLPAGASACIPNYIHPSRSPGRASIGQSISNHRWQKTARLFSSSQESPVGRYEELSVQDLGKLYDGLPSDLEEMQFVDVREPWEVEKSSLPQFKTYPLGQLLDGGEDDLDSAKDTITLCHHGVRSRRAAAYLLDRGFKRVYNVTGGIDAYSRNVDPSIPIY